jgi:aryl-alcohol dehydrogenase-like predicted oxidoreductase
MEYRNLGRSGLQVSAVGLGCNNLGRQVDQAGTIEIVNKCVEMGITFFDTADVYGGTRGASEECLGKALKPHRRDVVLATKGSGRMGDGPYWSGNSRRYLMNALEASLRRLDTDYVDLYELHFPDPHTPIDETLRALEDMVRSGKVRYVGCCNFSASQVSEAALASETGKTISFISAQSRYNLLERQVRDEVLPTCERLGIGMLPFYPLSSGLLTGKYRRDYTPEGTRLTSGIHFYAGVLENADYDLLERLESFAQERGHSLLELAIGWLASQPVIASVITGATRVDQIEQNARAGDWRLTAVEMQEVESILTGTSEAGASRSS